jgi:putative hydrolase of the HAD superfamily
MKSKIDVDFIIFDLGNVIIDLDYKSALKVIKNLVPDSAHPRIDSFYLTDFHRDYEKGLLQSDAFRNEVRAYLELDFDDQKVDDLWNCLLGKIPSERLKLIEKLRENYQVGVLSNTNLIHIHAVNRILQRDHGIENFDPIFDWVFLSHEMGLSKPSPEIYEKMLMELGTSADRVLFFDDLEANIKGANSVGINAVHVTDPSVIFEYFENV